MLGIKTLTIGYTRDIELAERVARATGAKELCIETKPEGDTLMLNPEEQAQWRSRGWTLVGRTAKKTLVPIVGGDDDDTRSRTEGEDKKSKIQSGNVNDGYSEGGRLKASMLIRTGSEGRNEEKEKKASSQDDDTC